MQICIVTVYNTENCGSFLQAYALQRVLEDAGHQVFFLYRDKAGTAHSVRGHLRESLVKCAKLDFRAARLVWRRFANYRRAQALLPELRLEDAAFRETGCVVLGSDTIWNFSEPAFWAHRDRYTGMCFPGKRCIAYAASAANTPLAAFTQDPKVGDAIGNLAAVSVRDEDTRRIVKELTGREAALVCDPTILAERAVFDRMAPALAVQGGILLYYFGKIPKPLQETLLRLKKEWGCPLLSFGAHRPWCDQTIANDPFLFLSHMKNAGFVITNTFHGTIFSILYERPFADYGAQKKKVAHLLQATGLERTIAQAETPLTREFAQGLDFSAARAWIAASRARSMRYLNENLTEMAR